MEDEDQKELQLLPAPHTRTSSSHASAIIRPSDSSTELRSLDPLEGPSLELQLSTTLVGPIRPAAKDHYTDQDVGSAESSKGNIQALKWQAAEQIWLAAIEKAYAERMRELSRREMELAQIEFAHARTLWEKAKDEVEKAETMQIDSTCMEMEMTCHSCRQRFRPS